MDTHTLLKDWHGHPDYPEIAQVASMLDKNIKDFPQKGQFILGTISKTYNPVQQAMKESPAPLSIWGEDLIDLSAVEQMKVALRMEPAIRGALMPDAHLGYGLPIGGVISLNNAISPNLVGFDISCMMMLTKLSLSASDFRAGREFFRQALRKSTSFGVGSTTASNEHPVMDSPTWDISPAIKGKREKAANQLGSSGGGNHFANLMIGSNGQVGGDEFVCLLTHSGSRGTGHDLAVHYGRQASEWTNSKYKDVTKGYEWLDLDTDIGKEYLLAMTLMGEYALANHQIIHDSFLQYSKIEKTETIFNRHNYAWETEDGVIHRKGATPAHKGVVGIIPGSCSAPSFIVKGLGNEASLNSASHGAGRRYSRTMAKTLFDAEEFMKTMSEQGIMYEGINADEGFMSYKNIYTVLSRQRDLIERVSVLRPSIVLMGGKSDDGD